MTNATETRPPAETPSVFVEAAPDVQTEATPSPGAYAMGDSNIFMELLQRRSAPRNAAHLLPLLRPEMTLLDLGCGPGSITSGLAAAVHPGRTHGVDLNEEQLGLARQQAQELGLENLEFHQSNALRLPFPDQHFDAVHCHGFLMHSPCIKEQLAEILRVLKPRGILASRDMDIPTSFITPAALSHKIFGMLAEVIRREGGNPWMGRASQDILPERQTGRGGDRLQRRPLHPARGGGIPEEIPPGMGTLRGIHVENRRFKVGLRPVARASRTMERAPRRGGLLQLRPRGRPEARMSRIDEPQIHTKTRRK